MSDYINPNLVLASHKIEPGKVTWKSPSNIALIKYWGKHGNQLPNNPSLSFTLSEACTTTTLSYKPIVGKTQDANVTLYFEGERKPDFEYRVQKFFASLDPIFPFLKQLHIQIDTTNSFPHSSGIASSASAMSALSLCVCNMERLFFGHLEDEVEFSRKASYIARLGSGSASRSVYTKAATWGGLEGLAESSDLHASPFGHHLHETFSGYKNSIILVSDQTKQVSSTEGHALMDANPFASTRYAEARNNMRLLIPALKGGDLEPFIQIVETEALHLHALMMASNPYYMLFEPDSIAIIKELWAFRKEQHVPVCFTMDAGPNVHVLYPESATDEMENFFAQSAVVSKHQILKDQLGDGPLKIVE